MATLSFGCGVRALYRHYRERAYPEKASEALFLARMHEGRPTGVADSGNVRRHYREYRKSQPFLTSADTLRIARCHAEAQ